MNNIIISAIISLFIGVICTLLSKIVIPQKSVKRSLVLSIFLFIVFLIAASTSLLSQ